MKYWISALVLVLMASFQASAEELVFEPVSSGNFAILHLNDEEVFLINTGSPNSQGEVLRYLNKVEDKHIKGILITQQTANNCGNLSEIVNRYKIDNIYMAKHDNSTCEIPQSMKKYTYQLTKNDRMAISSKYYIEFIFGEDSETGNFAISNGEFSCFWYENHIEIQNWDHKVQILYLPDQPSYAHLTEQELIKLDPEVAIINQRQNIKSLIELFQKQWVDIYTLKRGASAHISIVQNDYDFYLKKD
ncbi:hypothetical protein [Aquisalibacillus elongatus]|uniref:Beta-lactamase superfamily II metal-dependent hydrolase n=1 Tax=Aquisalibacillus elongatus TaxID=485577 RepID=A0A3N5BEA3_9BACI|nr:hypothetical protein [Aquisalibacillus elongatus]RPF55793.1 hypothetical protein EDC24_0677 [Aquisalibacillus elongatus]